MKTPAEIAREYLHRWDRQPVTGDLSNRGSLEMHVRAAIEEALHQERAQADARVAAEPVAYHLRRRLSDRELAQLDPGWCAIPAEDLAGEGEPW